MGSYPQFEQAPTNGLRLRRSRGGRHARAAARLIIHRYRVMAPAPAGRGSWRSYGDAEEPEEHDDEDGNEEHPDEFVVAAVAVHGSPLACRRDWAARSRARSVSSAPAVSVTGMLSHQLPSSRSGGGSAA